MKHLIHFTKMQGLGNDFILVDAINQQFKGLDFPKTATMLCHRRLGIGADGLILVEESDHSDVKMTIYNADGSVPQMCGNGIRCLARFVYENKLVEKDVFSVETQAGVIVPALIMKNGEIKAIEVDMGEPRLLRGELPMQGQPEDQVISEMLSVDGEEYPITCVSMGNPHAVVFVDDLSTIELDKLGPKFESHPVFLEGVNTEFCEVMNPNKVKCWVWERGSGATCACGTGACATVVAGVLNKCLERKVEVHLPGGVLRVEWQASDNHVIMTGPSQSVYHGRIFVP